MSESDLEEQNAEDNSVENDEEIQVDLIQAVKKREILYNPASVSNRNKFLREKAWSDIAQEIGKPGKMQLTHVA